MHFEISDKPIGSIDCDTLIIGVFEEKAALSGAVAEVDKATSGLATKVMAENSDIGKFGQSTVLHINTPLSIQRIIILGLGKSEVFTLDKLRAVSAIGIRTANRLSSKKTATLLHGADMGCFEPGDAAQALTEGIILGNYHFAYYKTSHKSEISPEAVSILGVDRKNTPQVLSGMQTGQKTAQSVNLSRDLVNHPANVMTPGKLARQAGQIAEQCNLDITILNKTQIEELNMAAFMAVAKGSEEPANMILLRYKGAPDDARLIALIGKGITFDSGGLSLKPSYSMYKMKDDMAGGAAVLAATQAIAELGIPINLLTIVPCTENMPANYAYKPGDVISSLSGQSIEIISTDAEGRLILADALTYAQKSGATQIIDVATLTTSCAMALGNGATGVFGNNQTWTRQILEAAAYTGEKMWEMPIFEEYHEHIKSEIADLKNSGGRLAEHISAAVFLSNFIGKLPWVHLDIAGTAFSDKESGYTVKGATGVGVRTLVQLARSLGKG